MQRVLALLLLVIVSPILLIFYAIVKLTSKGPFIFRQKRSGKNFQPFYIYKIRTMVDGAEKMKRKFAHLNEVDGPVFKIKNDPRFTPFGRVLAYTGFDEILQLINIIKGEMSFVGPRPLPVDEAVKVPTKYHKRFLVKPGVTSLWVIRGAHNLSFTAWMESDLEYIRKRNVFLDLSIFIITILSIIKWSGTHIFLFFYPLVLVFFAISPDSIWWFQIFTFFPILFFLGLDFNRTLPKTYIFLAILLFLSTVFSINKISSVPYFFTYLLVFFLSATFIEYQKEILLKSYVFGSFIMGILSTLYTLFRALSIDIPHNLYFLDTSINLIIPHYGYAFYTIFLIAVFPYVLERVLEEKVSFWYLIFICFIIFFLLSFSKTAIFVCLLEMVLLLFMKRQKKKSIKRILIPTITIASIFVLFLIIAIPKNQWIKEKIYKPSLSARFEYLNQDLKVLQNMSLKRTLVGYGLDNFFELSNMYQSKPNIWTKSSHNFFIQFLIENGIIAVFTLVIFIIYSFRKNFKNYSLSEKIILVSLIIYSLGSIYDLNALPILMLFFILLMKPSSGKIDILSQSAISKLFYLKSFPIIYLTIIAIFFLFWARYLINYSSFFLFTQQNLQAINLFPYDSAFWTILVDNNATRTDELIAIKNKLKQYSEMNADLNKYIIRKIFQSENYCSTTYYSWDYLKLIPYDLDVQNIFMQSSTKCTSLKNDQMTDFFQTIKQHYEVPSSDLSDMRGFFQFIAAYYYNHGYTSLYQFWLNKAWQVDLKNDTNIWIGYTFKDPGQEILVTGPFEIIINLQSIGVFSSGINLYGRLDDTKLFIGIADNGSLLHIDISDKSTTSPLTLFDGKLKNADKSLRFIFGEDGINFKIFDSSGSLLGKVDINEITDNRFPQGLFPDKKIYLGYGAAPKSYLTIEKFLFKPI